MPRPGIDFVDLGDTPADAERFEIKCKISRS